MVCGKPAVEADSYGSEGRGVKEQSDATHIPPLQYCLALDAASWDFELCRLRSRSWPIVRI